MQKWFGYECKYFIGQWEYDVVINDPDYKKSEPVLKYCDHPKNLDDHEGNCNLKECPLGK